MVEKILSNKTLHNFQGPDSTSNEDKSGLIWKIASNHSRSPINNINRITANIDDEISKIVHWSVKWLMEQNNCDMSPPVNGEKEPVKMPLSINSFSDYYNIVVPLIMLELWQYIYQTLYNKDEER
ncbi:hypothetical protein NQ314_006717 [Rhamnusium bicolor]|uniref:Uncharacterized protein n=1 Tax=Rhamnusium bicolor TaxID=1586634 RepID=A0AAV8YYR8_9CUCU|nr:hypothetical protein NQ314_006717 [Rhamnusium bicolor]